MPDGPALARMAFPFMPADPARRGSLVEAGPGWALELPASASELDVVVWGRAPDTAASAAQAVRSAVARERALRRLPRRLPAGFRLGAVHRLPAGRLSAGLRRDLRSAIRAGALVELQSGPPVERVLDAALSAAASRLSVPRSSVRLGWDPRRPGRCGWRGGPPPARPDGHAGGPRATGRDPRAARGAARPTGTQIARTRDDGRSLLDDRDRPARPAAGAIEPRTRPPGRQGARGLPARRRTAARPR